MDIRQKEQQHWDDAKELWSAHPGLHEVRLMADTYSYEKAIEFCVVKDLHVARKPIVGVNARDWPREVRLLEIGFGQGTGIQVAQDKCNIPEDMIAGIEVIPEHFNDALLRFPDAHLSLLGGEPEELPNTLRAWAQTGLRFHVIIARHMMEHVPNPTAVLEGINALLAIPGRYCQITPPWKYDDEPAHVTKLAIESDTDVKYKWHKNVRRRTITRKWKPGGWPDLLTNSGFVVTEGGSWGAIAHAQGHEYYLIARKRGESEPVPEVTNVHATNPAYDRHA